MPPTRSKFKDLELKLLDPLQDQPHRRRWSPMAEEKKDEEARDLIKFLLKITFE